MRTLGLIVAGWCVLASSLTAGAVTVDDLPLDAIFEVKEIRIEGLETLSKGDVREVMVTKARTWYKPWTRWTEEHPFNAAIFQADVERVRNLLRESGFYRAQVSYDLVVSGAELTIVLTVIEGPRVTVSEITIEASDYELTEEIRDELNLQLTMVAGDPFTQEAYDESRAKILRFHLAQGYAYAEVDKKALVDTTDNTARVWYGITRGSTAVFGTTEITGLDRVSERIVRREITYQPGDPYDAAEVEKTQARVFGLQLFRSVIVEPSNLPERTGIVDVRITAIEGPSRNIKVGIGYGTEDEVRGLFEWRNNNLFGDGRRARVALKASTINQTVEAEFIQPHFFHPRQSLIVPLTQERKDEPGFTLLYARLAPRVQRRFGAYLTVSVGYGFEYDDLTDVPQETIDSLDDFRSSGFVSSLFSTIERNTADDLLDPKRGSILNLTAEQAGGPWQADFTFYKVAFEAKRYLSVWGERVLAGRFRIGVGDGFGQTEDLPLFRRFFAGGVNSTRGYNRYKVGPLTSRGDPIGGRSLMEGSIEFRSHIWKGIGGVVFFDAAVVDEQPLRYPFSNFQFGAGPGVRYNTPIGPLRLDLGFPIDPPAGQPDWRVHFSVGQAF